MKITISIMFVDEDLSSITPERIVKYEDALVIPIPGDYVTRVVNGRTDTLHGEVISRRWTYFEDQVRVILTLRR